MLSKAAAVLLAISIGLIAFTAVMLFHFAMPVWDDLVRASRPAQVGWWRYVYGFVYCHWQGRWASSGLESFVLPRVDITRFYWVLIAAVAAVDAVGAYVVCRWFTATESRRTSAGLTAGLLALLWAGMPSLGEMVYWFTGAVENAMVLALAAMVVVTLMRMPSCGRIFQIMLLSISALVICGFHELYGAMFCMVLGMGTLASFIAPGTNKTAWIVVTIGAGIGLAIVVLAPGNSERLVTDGGAYGRHVGYDLGVALKEFCYFAPRWLIDPKVVTATIFVAFSPMLKANRSVLNPALPWRWIVPAVWLMMLGLGFILPSWAFGIDMPMRTLSGNYVVFVIGWLITVHLWTGDLSLPTVASIANIAFAIALLTPGDLIANSLLKPGNLATARRDYRDRLRPWHRAVEARNDQLRKAGGTDAIVVPLPKPPWSLLNGDVVDDPGDYHNWATVDFFHLRSIRLKPATGSPPPPPLEPTRSPAEIKGF